VGGDDEIAAKATREGRKGHGAEYL